MALPHPPEAPKTQKKRRRPALACEQCRKRKIRCDRNVPCNHCIKSNITDCSYVPTHIPASWLKRNQKAYGESSRPTGDQPPYILPIPAASNSSKDNAIPPSEFIGGSREIQTITARPTASAPSSVTGSTSNASNNVDRLVSRIHHLEEKLANVVTISDDNDHASPEDTQSSAHIHGTVSKTRYFGRSHWMNGPALLPMQMKILHKAEVEKGDLSSLLLRCKALGRTIKENRLKPLSTTDLGRNIPSRELADELVESYLRTFEGVFRILHVPSFRAEYERYWQNPSAASDCFTIQLQLVVALGAIFHDETFSLRARATQWVYEAQLWLMLPPEKSRMTIAGIQIMCLLTLARSACSVGQDLIWITTGGLVRKAMYMGMHRDPKDLADMTTYRAEMRRRLWATILELNLQSAFDAGGPPLISSLDYDVQPPADLDDDQLGDEPDRERTTVKSDTVTQMSVPLELFKSLPLRLNLLRHANDFRSGESYDETLRFNSELTKACRSFSQSMTIFIKNQQGKPYPRASHFHASLGELLLYRCFHTLHQPIISRSLDDPRFYFSRKMYLDGALKVTHILNLSGPRRAQGPGGANPPQPAQQSDFDRLITNASGVFRNIPMQSLPSLMLELLQSKAGSAGEHGMGMGLGYLPAVHDYDLRATIEAGKEWSLQRIRSGETNVKGYCFVVACLQHIDAVEAGMDQKAMEAALLEGTEEAARMCLGELKALADREGLLDLSAARTEAVGEAVEVPGMGMGMGMGVDDMAVDFMGGDWGWDDMNGLLWGSPRPFDDHHPPIFA